jgi:hypothetical protein
MAMMRGTGLIAGLVAMGLTSVPMALAAPKVQPRPEIFTRLLDCRSIADSTQRLACYDQQVAAIDTAAQRDEVVVLDKEELKKTRRSLFGFSLPKLPFLSGGDTEDAAEASESHAIESTIATLTSLGYGKWALTIEDGAEWQTTEALPNRTPKKGMTVEIKRAAMGSFMLSINGWHPIRAKRVG